MLAVSIAVLFLSNGVFGTGYFMDDDWVLGISVPFRTGMCIQTQPKIKVPNPTGIGSSRLSVVKPEWVYYECNADGTQVTKYRWTKTLDDMAGSCIDYSSMATTKVYTAADSRDAACASVNSFNCDDDYVSYFSLSFYTDQCKDDLKMTAYIADNVCACVSDEDVDTTTPETPTIDGDSIENRLLNTSCNNLTMGDSLDFNVTELTTMLNTSDCTFGDLLELMNMSVSDFVDTDGLTDPINSFNETVALGLNFSFSQSLGCNTELTAAVFSPFSDDACEVSNSSSGNETIEFVQENCTVVQNFTVPILGKTITLSVEFDPEGCAFELPDTTAASGETPEESTDAVGDRFPVFGKITVVAVIVASFFT